MVWFRWFRRSCSHREALGGLVSLVPSVLLARDGPERSGFGGSVGPARTGWPCKVWFRWFRRSCSHKMALKGLISVVPSVLLAQDGPERSGFAGSVGPARTRWLSKVWIRWFRRSCSHKMALHGLVSLVLSVLLAQKCLLQALRLMYYRLITINMYWCIIYLYIICIHILITQMIVYTYIYICIHTPGKASSSTG